MNSYYKEKQRRIEEGGLVWVTSNYNYSDHNHSKYYFLTFGHLTQKDAKNEIESDDMIHSNSMIVKGIFIV